MSGLAEINGYEDQYTYADMLEWDEAYRAEIIDGALYAAESPAAYHQKIVSELTYQLMGF
ncbi:hypothetical protein FACS1894109_06500 [Spirochaetia bacterium]|nr:hypothetical protein FACS1894109_06500 [Spirochaetia bacterium]